MANTAPAHEHVQGIYLVFMWNMLVSCGAGARLMLRRR